MSKTLFTLISYRPNGSDYCRGCLMDTSDSDFDIDVSDDIEEISLLWAHKMYADHIALKDQAICGWECTLLINGHKDGNFISDSYDANGGYVDFHGDLRQEVETKARADLKKLIAHEENKRFQAEERKATAAAAAAVRKQLEHEQHERDEYERLSKKFETPMGVKTLAEQVAELKASDSYELDDGC